MQKLSWKEKYAAIIVLIIGIIFLLMQIASIASNNTSSYAAEQGAFVINKNELFSDIKTWVVVIMGISAGFLLLKKKTLGWVLGLPILLLFTTMLIVHHVVNTRVINSSLTIPAIGLLLLVLAISFLLAKSARKHYRVSNRLVTLTLLLFAGIGALYFFLQ
jgi:hypothetical protein